MALHITNGDAAAEVMVKAGIEGDILPWRDVLHEGPVPGGLALENLSEVRAAFIADSGWADQDEVASGFRDRDAKLSRFRDHEEVVLWFEHDLYDQLQLLQLLDWFSRQDPAATRLSMIRVDEYLGPMEPGRLAALYPQRRPVAFEQLGLGRRAWAAFCAEEPEHWEALLTVDTAALPFLAGAVVRHLEQYPSLANGTSRTERSLLAAVQAGESRPGRIFAATQDVEERRFMGDSTFWSYLGAMTRSRPPLLQLRGGAQFHLPEAYPYPAEFEEQKISITDAGRRVHANEADWLQINGIDKWLGGVHLQAGNVWRWDADRESLVKSGKDSRPYS